MRRIGKSHKCEIDRNNIIIILQKRVLLLKRQNLAQKLSRFKSLIGHNQKVPV